MNKCRKEERCKPSPGFKTKHKKNASPLLFRRCRGSPVFVFLSLMITIGPRSRFVIGRSLRLFATHLRNFSSAQLLVSVATEARNATLPWQLQVAACCNVVSSGCSRFGHFGRKCGNRPSDRSICSPRPRRTLTRARFILYACITCC